LTSITIPNCVTSIWDFSFYYCTNLIRITIPNSVSSIGASAFGYCTSLTSITIPNSVTTLIGTFNNCTNLISVTIPDSVTNLIGTFNNCASLTGVYFKGNAPSIDNSGGGPFTNANKAIVYYLPGTTGWGPTFGGRPTALWDFPPGTLEAIKKQPDQPTYGTFASQLGKDSLVVVTHGWQKYPFDPDISWVDSMSDSINSYFTNHGLNNW